MAGHVLGRWFGVRLILVSTLPSLSGGALSISSGYESFLTDIRRRIVCAEGDVYDELLERGRARPCDSMEDGPFCRGLPGSRQATRLRPFTVDSIVPQHLFGEWPTSTLKEAAATLNIFLEHYYKPKESQHRVHAVEGRIDFQGLRPARSHELMRSFSKGLPTGIISTFDGAWQEVSVPHNVGGERRNVAVRLNGAIGSLHFSRPVVLRRLIVRPPLNAMSNRHRMFVRGRKAGKEVWRREYRFDATTKSAQPICEAGDVVFARFVDGRYFLAVLLSGDEQAATVRWLDDAFAYRHIPWQNIKTPAGTVCGNGDGDGPSLEAHVDAAASGKADDARLWRDVARHVKAVDEVTFSVLSGADGWLVSEIAVAAPRWTPRQGGTNAADDKKRYDPMGYMMQVFPGRLAAVVEASQAAVLYDADDMLERGLRVRSDGATANSAGSGADVQVDNGEGSARLRTSMNPLVDGFLELLRGLAKPVQDGVPVATLPPHVTLGSVLSDAEVLVTALSGPTRSEVKTYGHFEQYFSAHWDMILRIDALAVTYERWRHDTAVQEFGKDVFYEGQTWSGVYFCTQGLTAVALEVTSVTETNAIAAELTFWVGLDSKKSDSEAVRGSYSVSGRLDPTGRTIALEPVPNSWKDKPSNFVMVGLHGIVTKHGMDDGSHRFAGSVPIYGCDSFELQASAPGEPVVGESHGATSSPEAQDSAPQDIGVLAENAMLARLTRAIDVARANWRTQLRSLIEEKKQSGSSSTSTGTSDASSTMQAAVAQLLKAAGRRSESEFVIEGLDNMQENADGTLTLRLGEVEFQVQQR
mmetsp:Transcript_42063/g.116161  ORF Transcript_42063/g.116161 Transcript_42063/m.116161 type:complete len:811 (+) Transcript_42063:223-2655(+)